MHLCLDFQGELAKLGSAKLLPLQNTHIARNRSTFPFYVEIE